MMTALEIHGCAAPPPERRRPAARFTTPRNNTHPRYGCPRGAAAGTLGAKRLKIATTLDAAELLAITAPDGKPRITLTIRLPDRTVRADIAAKSLRKAQTAIREKGVANIVLVQQGSLVAGDVIAEAGSRCAAGGGENTMTRPGDHAWVRGEVSRERFSVLDTCLYPLHLSRLRTKAAQR